MPVSLTSTFKTSLILLKNCFYNSTFQLDCGLLCLLTDRRRYIEILWRHRLLVTADERKAKRRFMKLMRGFDSEDLEVLRKAVESKGIDIKQCAPGPPMDIVESDSSDDEVMPTSSARRQSIISTHRVRRYSTVRLDHVGGTTITTVTPLHNHVAYTRRGSHLHRVPTTNIQIQQHQPLPQNHISPTIHRQGSQSRRSPRQGSSRHGGAETASTSGETRIQPRRGRESDDPLASHPALKLIGDTGEFEERGLIPQIDRPMSMPYLCCKMWRWKDLQVDAALHRLDPLPWCRFGRVTINNATVSCCNPFHYGLWIRPELSSQSEQNITAGIVANGGNRIIADRSTTGDTGFEMSIGHVRSTFHAIEAAASEDTPPPDKPPAPPTNIFANNTTIDTPLLLNHLSSIHSQALSWGRMARWERKERIGEMVALVGQFVAVGKLAGTVFDGQDIKSNWDLENHTSFALIKQSETERFEDVWLYNSGDRPIFLCVSQSLNNPHSADAIRRLSPGYCLRVHRKPIFIDEEDPTQLDEPTLSVTQTSNIRSASISFLTISSIGWGLNYRHMYVTDCPVRYEIVFS
ncbi:hypothetical protein M3Y97_00392500 [Aphelenchoides bicaudatus]|nr:hypothetical protein M3Y97_00392500 [Aphelenchoides bicaudatus]